MNTPSIEESIQLFIADIEGYRLKRTAKQYRTALVSFSRVLTESFALDIENDTSDQIPLKSVSEFLQYLKTTRVIEDD